MKKKVVVVRDVDAVRGLGKIGAVSVRIPAGLLRDYEGTKVVPVAVRSVSQEDGHGDQVIAMLEGGPSILISSRDVLEVEDS